MGIAVDSSSPIRWTGTPADNVDVASAAFTAPANALLVVCVELDSDTTGTVTAAVSDTGSLSWTFQVSRLSSEATLGGMSGIFTARTTSAVSRQVNVRRTVSGGGGGGTDRVSAKCYVVTTADVDGTPVDAVDANNEGGSATNNLTTTLITPSGDGLLFGADCDWTAGGGAPFEAPSDGSTQDTALYAGAISACDGWKVCVAGRPVGMNFNAGGGAAAQHKWCQIVVREAPTSAQHYEFLNQGTRPAPYKPGLAR